MLVDERDELVMTEPKISSELVSEKEQELIRAYLQGAVYAWCNCKRQEEFCFATFAGGGNYFWEGTYLYPLYENQAAEEQGEAVQKAGMLGGALLKQVLQKDKRKFKLRKHLRRDGCNVNKYSWIDDVKAEV